MNVLERKCAKCKNIIEIDKNNISGVIHYDKKYYHKSCFKELATQRAASNRGKPAQWQEALNQILDLEIETKKMIEYFGAKDDLNEWLLSHYNITAVPSRFWQIIADLGQGVYKGKQCKVVPMDTILGMWKWGQQKLNQINRTNKMNNKGPSNDEARLVYDLAILVNKVPNYLAHKAKMEVLQAEAKGEPKVHINYNDIQKTEIKHEGLDDISSLLDEF